LQLFARLEGEPAELSQRLPFELVIRGSTGPPPAAKRRERR
jgi:DNA-binding LacI/PurR family transcriptional regulator